VLRKEFKRGRELKTPILLPSNPSLAWENFIKQAWPQGGEVDSLHREVGPILSSIWKRDLGADSPQDRGKNRHLSKMTEIEKKKKKQTGGGFVRIVVTVKTAFTLIF